MGITRGLWVDDTEHMLHFHGQAFPCDRDIESAMPWREYALLLSSDTDSLSLWDAEGLVRLAKVGVYPQDMAVRNDRVIVCGGTDCQIHILRLPALTADAVFSVPGMPERICFTEEVAFILTLLTEPEVHTALLVLELNGRWSQLRQFSGIPEAIAADKSGLWIALSDGVTRLRWEEIGT